MSRLRCTYLYHHIHMRVYVCVLTLLVLRMAVFVTYMLHIAGLYFIIEHHSQYSGRICNTWKRQNSAYKLKRQLVLTQRAVKCEKKQKKVEKSKKIFV